MTSKHSIVHFSTIATTICLLLHIAIIEAREESEVDSSINSGIRSLELLRRQIIESRKARTIPSVEEPPTSGYSRFHGAATREESNLPASSTGSRHPRRQVHSAMYEALSKIANVQIADPSMEHSSGGRSSADQEAHKQFYKNLGSTRNIKNERSPPKTSTKNSNNLPYASKRFHCRPIQDIYIPKVDKRMPAYLCTFGKRAFVISSERFHQDSRDHFEVSVDENTFSRLNPINSGTATLTSGVSVLPATLVLKRGEDGYTVRGSDKVLGTSNV